MLVDCALTSTLIFDTCLRHSNPDVATAKLMGWMRAGCWLEPPLQDAATTVGPLHPFESKLMERYPVSTRVNLVANDDPECSAPVHLPAAIATTFRLIETSPS